MSAASLDARLRRLESRHNDHELSRERSRRALALLNTPDADGQTLADYAREFFGPEPPALSPGADPNFVALIHILYPTTATRETP